MTESYLVDEEDYADDYYEDPGDDLAGAEFDWDEMDEEDWENYFDPGLAVTDPDLEEEF